MSDKLLKLIEDSDSCVEVRINMAINNWKSEDNLTNIGWGNKYGYSISFIRWDWHGVSIGEPIKFTKYLSDTSEINEGTKDLALMVLELWEEHKNTIPKQLSDGSIIVDKEKTTKFFN